MTSRGRASSRSTRAARWRNPAWAGTARALLAPALAARARPVVAAGTLLCAEEVSARVAARARLAVQARGQAAVFIAPAGLAVSAEQAAELVAAEARLSGDAALAKLAATGRVEVLPEASLAPARSVWRRALAALAAAVKGQWSGEEPAPARRPAWSTLSP